MSAERNFTDQDYELLSAYLDGALTEAERTALETRLQSDDRLRQELAALQQTVNLVRGLPPLKAPRNFTLTPSMVRPRTARWLIFPTSAAFSAISAAAATVLILLGAGILLLQTNSAGAPNLAPMAVDQSQSTSQIAVLPTEVSLTSEKTAQRDQRETEETAAASNGITIQPSPPAVANSPTVPDDNTSSPLQAPQTPNEEQPAPVTTDGLGYTTGSGTTSGGEAGQAAQPGAPANSTLYYGPTMVAASAQPFASGAADTAAQNDGSIQQESNPPSSAAAAEAILSDQTGTTTTEAQFGADNQDLFGLFTATMPSVAQAAAAPTSTPMPTQTVAPTMTATPNPTATATPTPTSIPIPTQTPPAPSVQIAPVDLLTWGVLIIGVLLLVVAVITTIIRRRG